MIRFFTIIALVSVMSYAQDVLAVVNGHKITSDVAPKDFKKLDKTMQKKIVNRLVEKRLASDYALSTDIVKSKEYQKTLKHVLSMSDEKDNKKSQQNFLANILKDSASIKGYTKEQLYSKKGLLAFDFLVNEQADKIKGRLSNKKLKEAYSLNKYKYDTPAMKELYEIVVENRKTANIIMNKLNKAKHKREVFMQLARKYSLAPSKQYDGYFGKVAVHDLNSKIKPVIQNLKVYQVTKKPIKTEFGYIFYYVINDIPAFNSKFELVKSRVSDEYIQKEVKKWAMNLIASLKSKAKIKIFI